MYVIEAMIEYFISIAVGTVYLARITQYIGMSDALTGILSSFVSLGCGFQLVAIFIARRRPVKRWVTILHTVSQGMFSMLYIVPVFNFSKAAKTVLFVIMLLGAQIIHNVINAPKINWYMSLVDDGKRGSFTANKEMVSLIGGMIFSFLLGTVMDEFMGRGEPVTAFIVCGIGLFILTALHSATLIFSKEKTDVSVTCGNPTTALKDVLKDKNLLKILLVSVLWSIAHYATISFSGTYQAKELSFSAVFSSVIIMVGSLVRALVSKPLGKFADKFSFVKMLLICFSVASAGYFIMIFTMPDNGKYLYPAYYVLYCVGMGGINSAMINLIFDYVGYEHRTSALAINQSFSGFAGFLTTLALSPLVSYIQRNENIFVGIHVYAQQITACFSFLITAILIVYLVTVVQKIPRKNKICVSDDFGKANEDEESLNDVIK